MRHGTVAAVLAVLGLMAPRSPAPRSRTPKTPQKPPAATLTGSLDAAETALASRWRPPGAVSAADREVLTSRARDSARGPAAWPGRTNIHPGAPRALLARHAHRDELYTRFAALKHPACPLPLLWRFADDEDDAVRRAVGLDPRCPQKLLAASAATPTST